MNYPHQFVLHGEVFPYNEKLINDKDGYDYLYNISVVWNGRDGEIAISRWGVSMWYDDDDTVTTNIEPDRLFPNKKQLTIANLQKIIRILERIGLEGMTTSKEQMDLFYQKYGEK